MRLQCTVAAALLALAAGCENYNDSDDGLTDVDDTVRTTPRTTTPPPTPGSDMDATDDDVVTVPRSPTTPTTPSTPPRTSGTTPTGDPAAPGAPGQAGVLAQADRTFLMEAASAGMFEVQSSQLAVDQLDDEALKETARMIIDDHQQANNELKQIAQRKGVTIPTTLQPNHQQLMTRLRDAEGTGLADQYRQMQIQAHQDAISKFEQYVQNGQDAELKAFAQKCLPKLRTHLEELQQTAEPSGAGG